LRLDTETVSKSARSSVANTREAPRHSYFGTGERFERRDDRVEQAGELGIGRCIHVVNEVGSGRSDSGFADAIGKLPDRRGVGPGRRRFDNPHRLGTTRRLERQARQAAGRRLGRQRRSRNGTISDN
jgi:hypothetical protein